VENSRGAARNTAGDFASTTQVSGKSAVVTTPNAETHQEGTRTPDDTNSGSSGLRAVEKRRYSRSEVGPTVAHSDVELPDALLTSTIKTARPVAESCQFPSPYPLAFEVSVAERRHVTVADMLINTATIIRRSFRSSSLFRLEAQWSKCRLSPQIRVVPVHSRDVDVQFDLVSVGIGDVETVGHPVVSGTSDVHVVLA